jgi:hypothetical protein
MIAILGIGAGSDDGCHHECQGEARRVTLELKGGRAETQPPAPGHSSKGGPKPNPLRFKHQRQQVQNAPGELDEAWVSPFTASVQSPQGIAEFVSLLLPWLSLVAA